MQHVWVILLFLPSALSEYTGRFRVVVPEAPVSSVSGSDVVLSCSVRDVHHQNIKINAVELNVTWSRSDLNNSLVHLYGNHKDLNTDQNPSYRGRTAVFKEQLKNGNVSLKISNIRITDEGEYRCRVDSTTWENFKTFKLLVEEHVPSEAGKIVGITIGVLLLVGVLAGVLAGVFFHFYNEKRKKEEEINEVTSLLNSDRDGRLKHQDLSQRQWEHVEETLLNSEEDLKEFILRKFDPSDRGVEKLKKVIASSKKALLKDCNLTEKSCADLVSVLSSENSLTELDLSLNKRFQDSGVEELCKGLKNSRCKLQNLRLEHCDLTEGSCTDLASVLRSENSLIELNLSENFKLKDSGVNKLCDGLKHKNCKLKILWLEDCNLTKETCEHLASVLKSENSLTEMNLSQNKIQDSGVKSLCDGLKDKNCKVQKLRLEYCDLTKDSCADLASVLQSEHSKLIELNLSKNTRMEDSGVKNLCVELNKNCKLEILRLEHCDLSEYSCEDLATVFKSENSLIELNLSENPRLKDSGVENLCDGLKDKNCKLQKLGLAECNITDKGFTALASALHPSSPLEELDLSRNELKESELKLIKFPKLKVKLDGCSVTDEGCAALASENHSSPLKEQDLSGNDLKESELEPLTGDTCV